MALIEFKNKPNTETPINDTNLNHNFKELQTLYDGLIETGEFTPSIRGGTTAGTISYTLQKGVYTKIGNMVFVDFKLGISSVSGADGFIRIEGLPYYHNRKSNQTVVMSVICQGGLFDNVGDNFLLWDGEGLIVSNKEQGLGGTKISDTTVTTYIYATGCYMINN